MPAYGRKIKVVSKVGCVVVVVFVEIEVLGSAAARRTPGRLQEACREDGHMTAGLGEEGVEIDSLGPSCAGGA